MADLEGTGLVATLGTALGLGLTYAINLWSKRADKSVGAANDGVQKDMLEFMKTQLESEVERREKVEMMYEALHTKFNDITKQMGLMELQNERLEKKVSELSDLVASLKGTPR